MRPLCLTWRRRWGKETSMIEGEFLLHFILKKGECNCEAKRLRLTLWINHWLMVNNLLNPPVVFRRTCGRGCLTPVVRWWRRLTCCYITPVYSRSWRGETSKLSTCILAELALHIHRLILLVFVALQRRKHAIICRGAPTTFHIFFNWEKVKLLVKIRGHQHKGFLFFSLQVQWQVYEEVCRFVSLSFQVLVRLRWAVPHRRRRQPPTAGRPCHVSLPALQQ